ASATLPLLKTFKSSAQAGVIVSVIQTLKIARAGMPDGVFFIGYPIFLLLTLNVD
ncbi:MAG: hypothetical protein ACJAXH_002934, partial [Colwellia sp.]